jgi:hypothetical protein
LSPFQIAAAWVGLRQEIRIAFMAQSHVNFPLNCFTVDYSGNPKDGGDWANHMVYLLAETLNACCGQSLLTQEVYELLVARAKDWMYKRPPDFAPVFFQNAAPTMKFPQCEYVNDVAG